MYVTLVLLNLPYLSYTTTYVTAPPDLTMAEPSKRSPNDGDGSNYFARNDRHKKMSRTSHLQDKITEKTPQIDDVPANTTDPMEKESDDDNSNFIGKALLASFTQANVWHTISPDDITIIIIESPSAIPAPSSLLDTNNKPCWDIIKSIPKTDILLPEELLPDTPFCKNLDQEPGRNLVCLQFPETGFLLQLSAWLIDNLKQYHHKTCLPVFSLAN
jgi:hypothetical protein